jgi:hypothetical protein
MLYSEPSLKVPPLERAAPAAARRRAASSPPPPRATSAATEDEDADAAAQRQREEDVATVAPARGRVRRAARAVSRGAERARSAAWRVLVFTTRFTLHLLLLALSALLRTAQLGALLLSIVGLPYVVSGPLLCLSLAASGALLAARALPRRRSPLREAGPAAALAADVALLSLGAALLADHCGCRGGAPLPAGVYAATRAASEATMRAAHVPPALAAAYHAYTVACSMLC